jgi:hypothetical protein
MMVPIGACPQRYTSSRNLKLLVVAAAGSYLIGRPREPATRSSARLPEAPARAGAGSRAQNNSSTNTFL